MYPGSTAVRRGLLEPLLDLLADLLRSLLGGDGPEGPEGLGGAYEPDGPRGAESDPVLLGGSGLPFEEREGRLVPHLADAAEDRLAHRQVVLAREAVHHA